MAPLMEWWHEHTAQLLDEGTYQHLKIQRRDGNEVVAHWDLLQEIKNDMVDPEAFAVEIFPEADRLVNEANIRHLWIIPREWVPVGLG